MAKFISSTELNKRCRLSTITCHQRFRVPPD
jgi:hypothetical protein